MWTSVNVVENKGHCCKQAGKSLGKTKAKQLLLKITKNCKDAMMKEGTIFKMWFSLMFGWFSVNSAPQPRISFPTYYNRVFSVTEGNSLSF